jgi:hypothetical protein
MDNYGRKPDFQVDQSNWGSGHPSIRHFSSAQVFLLGVPVTEIIVSYSRGAVQCSHRIQYQTPKLCARFPITGANHHRSKTNPIDDGPHTL